MPNVNTVVKIGVSVAAQGRDANVVWISFALKRDENASTETLVHDHSVTRSVFHQKLNGLIEDVCLASTYYVPACSIRNTAAVYTLNSFVVSPPLVCESCLVRLPSPSDSHLLFQFSRFRRKAMFRWSEKKQFVYSRDSATHRIGVIDLIVDTPLGSVFREDWMNDWLTAIRRQYKDLTAGYSIGREIRELCNTRRICVCVN